MCGGGAHKRTARMVHALPFAFGTVGRVRRRPRPTVLRSTPGGSYVRPRGRGLWRHTAPMRHRPSTPKAPHDSPSGKPCRTVGADGRVTHGNWARVVTITCVIFLHVQEIGNIILKNFLATQFHVANPYGVAKRNCAAKGFKIFFAFWDHFGTTGPERARRTQRVQVFLAWFPHLN